MRLRKNSIVIDMKQVSLFSNFTLDPKNTHFPCFSFPPEIDRLPSFSCTHSVNSAVQANESMTKIVTTGVLSVCHDEFTICAAQTNPTTTYGN